MRKEQHVRNKLEKLESQADDILVELRVEQSLSIRRALNNQLDALEQQIELLKWVLKEK